MADIKAMKSNDSHEVDKNGRFIPQASQFATPFGDQEDELPIEAGKYRLIWTRGCPFAHRLVILRNLLGLEDVISLGTTSPIRPLIGRLDWEFAYDEGSVDPVLGIRYLGDAYLRADPNYGGRPTVPALIDLKTRQVVQNDYDNLPYYFEREWQKYHHAGAPELLPADKEAEIISYNQMLSSDVNYGVYKAGLAKSQAAYEEAYEMVFKRFDELEIRLSSQRFLHGNQITDSDIRLFTTLVRFDIAYYNKFKLNRNRLIDYPNLWNYARDLYQTPGIGETVDFEDIRLIYHYRFRWTPDNTAPSILPKGPDLSVWDEPHDRTRFS